MLLALQLLCPGLMTTSPCGAGPAPGVAAGGAADDLLYLLPRMGLRRMGPPPELLDESLAMAGLAGLGRAGLLLAAAEDELKRRRH